MCPIRKVRSSKKRKNKNTRNWAVVISALFIIVVVVTAAYVLNPTQKKEPTTQVTDPAFNTFTQHYLEIMKSLNSTQTKSNMASKLNSSYNQTELFTWQQSKMVFAQDSTGWYEDPTQILNSGEGICVQWSIVYVSACLALGYQSRLVVAADASNWNFIHVWAEDYYNGTWVHVDPSDKVWNDPSRYQSWGWGNIGTAVKIYAFEDGSYQDVTATYSPH
jgi:transglutaminase-like putative cysteine protease